MSKIGSDGEKSCDACIDGSTGPAVVFCCTCQHLLCKPCHDHHKRNKISHHHQIVRLDKESLKILPFKKKSTKLLCSQPHHEKEELTFYCETCHLLTCRECTLVLHKDHNIDEICNIAKVHRNAMREALVCCQDITSKLTRATVANDMMAEQVKASRENATLIITQTFEQLHQTIEERKKAVLSEMEALSLSKTTALTLQKEQLMKMQDEIGLYTEKASHILQTQTDHEVLALGDLLPTELKAITKKVENVSLTPIQSSNMHVCLYTNFLVKELSIFGHVTDSSLSPSQSTWSSESAVAKVKEMYRVKLMTMTSKGERYPYGGLQVKAELRPKSQDEIVVPGKVEDHRDGTYTITLTPEIGGPHQLLITMDGQHVQNSPSGLDIVMKYSALCNPEQVINCSDFCEGLFSIAIHSSGDIYLTCRGSESIRVLDQTGHQKRTIGSSGSDDGQFDDPRGIFIKGDMLYIADTGNHRIQKLTTAGQFLQSFTCRRSSFRTVESVIVDQWHRLIVADYSRVVILDQTGTWLLTIELKDRSTGLAVDPQAHIHIATIRGISVYTPDGITAVRSYGNGTSEASGIVIDDEGYSFVNETNCLSIFDPRGYKVHTFGKLKRPRGVILDPKSGSLYVANCGAKNVLKYSV